MRRFAMSREFFRPRSYTDRFEVPELGIEVYFLEENGPVAKVFGGKRSKPDIYSRYKSAERRQEAVDEYIKREKERAAEKVKERKERKKLKTSLKPGDILYNSWGYDQTNIDFYKVVEVSPSGKTVKILPIYEAVVDGRGGPSEKVVPSENIKDYDVILKVDRGWDKQPIRKPVRIDTWGGEVYERVALGEGYSASKWDGEPLHQTGFGYGH